MDLPPKPKPGELSVRDKAVETTPGSGVYVTKIATRPVRLGSRVNDYGMPAEELQAVIDIAVGRRTQEALRTLGESCIRRTGAAIQHDSALHSQDEGAER